jgi:hypothetical protein
MEKLISKLALPLAAFGCIGAGLLHCSGIVPIGGYIYVRLGIALIAVGVALLGYWALANKSSDYNF